MYVNTKEGEKFVVLPIARIEQIQQTARLLIELIPQTSDQRAAEELIAKINLLLSSF